VEEAAVNPDVKYPWQEFVLDAFLEVESQSLQEKVNIAQRAISQRLRENPTDPEEYVALRDGLRALGTLIPKKVRETTAEQQQGEEDSSQQRGKYPHL
jgi:hypothetical protein